jgi:hypothetical protein
MMRAALLACLLVSSAWAHDPGDSGISVEYADGSIIEPNTTTLAIDGATLATSIDGSGRVVLTTGPLVTLLGQQIGDTAAEFASTVVFDGRTIDFDAVTDLMWPDPLILDTTVVGGTAATSTLNLRPTSSAAPTTATIKLCGGAGDNNTTDFSCLTAFPDGWTMGPNGGTTGGVRFINFTSTVTQDSTGLAGFPFSFLIHDGHTHDVTVGTTGTSIVTFSTQPTYKNATGNAVSGASVTGLYVLTTISNTGAGSLTIAKEAGVDIWGGSRSSGTTVTDKYGVLVQPATTSGTITDNYGVFVSAQAAGTNIFPFGAGEHAITGTVNASEGIWGVESGAPNRFYFKNESGHIWRMGYFPMQSRATGLATSPTTQYFNVIGQNAENATETNVDTSVPAMSCYAMWCSLDAAAGGGSDAHAFTLRDDTADTALSCTITTTAFTCTDREEAGVAIAANSLVTIEDTTTDTPVANNVNCTVLCNLTAW